MQLAVGAALLIPFLVGYSVGAQMNMGKSQLSFVLLCYLLANRQIGLGSGITLDTIVIPTEIDLARNIPGSTKSKCLSIIAG